MHTACTLCRSSVDARVEVRAAWPKVACSGRRSYFVSPRSVVVRRSNVPCTVADIPATEYSGPKTTQTLVMKTLYITSVAKGVCSRRGSSCVHQGPFLALGRSLTNYFCTVADIQPMHLEVIPQFNFKWGVFLKKSVPFPSFSFPFTLFFSPYSRFHAAVTSEE